MKYRSPRLLVLAAAAGMQLAATSVAESAVQRTWIGTNGLWSNAANWSPSGSPLIGDQVFLTQADATNRTVTYNSVFIPAQPSSVLQINATGSGTMTLSQISGYLTGESLLIGTTGQGEYDLNAGSANFANAFIASSAQIRVGDLNFATLTVGTFTQNNGNVVTGSGGTIYVTSNYQMNGGTLFAGRINSAGTFAMNSGVFSAGLNSSGTFLYNGNAGGGNGSINNAGTFIYNNPAPFATFLENHGTIIFNFDAQLNGLQSFSSFTLPAARMLTTPNVTIAGGTFTQLGDMLGDVSIIGGTWDQRAGKIATSTNLLSFNISGGTYLLSGTGSLDVNSTGPARVGYSGNGTFIQSGGSATSSAMIVGGEQFIQTSNGFSGYFGVSGGALNLNNELTIGPVFAASGTFNQSGGSVRAGTLTINENGSTTASATISGGSFTAGYLHNNGTFTMSGGTGSSLFTDGVGTMALSGSAHLITSVIRQQSLSLAGNASITKSFGVAVTDRVRTLTFDETGGTVHGSWDLGSDHLVIDYSGGSPIASIRRYLISGRANGQWTGAGLNSSAAAAAMPHNKALGYAEASQLFGASGGLFGALAVDNTSVLVRYTYYGDTDLNGVVNFDDYARVDAAFNNNNGTDWLHGDFDYNGRVDFDDYALIDLGFNTQSGALRRAVPEPGTLVGWLGAIGLLLARSRRRRETRCDILAPRR